MISLYVLRAGAVLEFVGALTAWVLLDAPWPIAGVVATCGLIAFLLTLEEPRRIMSTPLRPDGSPNSRWR